MATLIAIGAAIMVATLLGTYLTRRYKYSNPFSRTCIKCGAHYDLFMTEENKKTWVLTKPEPKTLECKCLKD